MQYIINLAENNRADVFIRWVNHDLTSMHSSTLLSFKIRSLILSHNLPAFDRSIPFILIHLLTCNGWAVVDLNYSNLKLGVTKRRVICLLLGKTEM